jgi:hypothetical protein
MSHLGLQGTIQSSKQWNFTDKKLCLTPDNPDKSTPNIKTSDSVIKNSSVQIASPVKKTDVHFVPIGTGETAPP